jgi:SpoVK/Ycf46/Vps4 family AAA+-type ATPase
MSQEITEAESTMRAVFEEAITKSKDKKHPEPSIIFIDEIDSIAPSAEKAQNEN